MKKCIILVAILLFCAAFALPGLAADSSITGVWSMPALKGKDKGKERLQVEISEKDGVYSGKIVKLSGGKPANALCATCKKERRGKPLMGMQVLWNLKKEAGRYVDGMVYDVDEGAEYKCSATLASPDQLKITACILFLCESHYWTKVK